MRFYHQMLPNQPATGNMDGLALARGTGEIDSIDTASCICKKLQNLTLL
jgi:hypothetical protein